MKRRSMVLMSALVAATMLLSACGGQKPAPAQTGGGTATPPAQTQTPTPPPVQAAVNKGDEITKAADMNKLPQIAKDRKDTMVIGIDAPDGVFNPLYAESTYDVYVASAVFDALVEPGLDASPVPGLAEKWDVSADGLTYTFKLRDAKFSDGTAVTADDVAFTYTVLADPKFDGPVDIINQTTIKGAKEYKDGKATSVEGVKVIDPKTVAITFTEVNAQAIWACSTGILEKAYYGKDYKQGSLEYMKDLHQKPVGTGPFKFVSYKAGQEVDLTANTSYFKGAPKVKNLIYKVTSEDTRMQQLQSGEIDMDMVTVNTDNVDSLKGAGFIDLHIFPTNGYGYIGMNFKKPQFQDKAVRQALAYGLDRKQIVQAVYRGYADVINIPQSKVSWAYATDGINAYDYDPAKANKLLDDAGWVKGSDGIRAKNGVKLEITFTASTPNPVNDAILPVAKANYEALGIKFTPEQMDFNAVRAKVNQGNVDMFFMAWGLTPDPDSTTVFASNGSQNKLAYKNTKVDELLKKGLQTTDVEKRKPIYKELYQSLNDDLPYIFMYQRRDMWAINGRLQGWEMSPYRDFTYSLYKAEIK